ncbi:MAG TPA: NAD(+)/NADH kinase [Candidatus Accumulibacter phosphatis]|nr:MAG: putative sugar kinase [Candidatus Accumulibacter sp. SK-11]HCN67079.1 sugar kinase [Accumulibacter sp.]HRL77057.1 NAD(+)/NADH kinase [Candidatus Accumulibacter phosphatis]HRQ96456.1 NAD(+)/NADH kinase [Candidatus Accumulibacter phosphatis]
MDAAAERKVVLVTRRTRLEELVARYHTVTQAKFYIEHLAADFSDYVREHEAYQEARRATLAILESRGRHQVIERNFLPNFVFGDSDIVVALGQDGLVANTMKYLDGQPLVGVNPEPARFDGVLLPFQPVDLARILPEVEKERRQAQTVTMAEAVLSDGQRLLGVNDLFIGPRTHLSAHYEIELGDQRERQSSSGIIVSTGLGSSAWMRSIVTGSLAIAGAYGSKLGDAYRAWAWDERILQFAVREPFPSRTSQTSLVLGRVGANEKLTLRSLMPESGVIFSDGIEADYLGFSSGMVARIGVADRSGRLVV